MRTDKILRQEILPFLPQAWEMAICTVDDGIEGQMTEIRLRVGQSVCVRYGQEEVILPMIVVTRHDLEMIVSALCHHSRYAVESELKGGYLTIRGGHRVGIAGQAVLDGGKIKRIKEISSMAIRIAREVIGSAREIIPYVYERGQIFSTLIVAPPYCGKTTILRDLIRCLSEGEGDCPGVQVALADERSEIAGVYRGMPMLAVGARTDVIDGAPKAEAMMLLVRAMSPRVIATDELGRKEDFIAVKEAVRTGVAVIATLHGRSWADVTHRMGTSQDEVLTLFERVIFLTDYPTIGTIREVVCARKMAIR